MSAQDARQRYQSATEALQVLNKILKPKSEVRDLQVKKIPAKREK